MFNEYNNILIDIQTNYTYENISPELILERNNIKYVIIEKKKNLMKT